MRKLFSILILLVLAILPVAAQDDDPTIVDIAADSPDFVTLVAALESAGLVDALSSEGPYTVFAPTDDGFAAALDDLGITSDELLADTEFLEQVLLYHVVEGEVSADAIRERADEDGVALLSTLQGAHITARVTEDGVFLNGDPLTEEPGVQIVDTDIAASNGLVHVIDYVLFPPAEDEVQTANLRVAHFSPDAPAVEVYLDGALSDIQTLAFPDMTGWIEIPAGSYEIAVAPVDTSLEDAIFGPTELSFAPNTWTTLTAVGSVQEGTQDVQVISEDLSTPIEPGEARLTIYHAIENAPAVDVLTGEIVLEGDLEYGDSITLDVPSDDEVYDIQIVPTGEEETVLIDLPDTEFQEGTFNFIAAVGIPDEPDVFIETLTSATISELLPQTSGTIIDVAEADGRFEMLIAALDAAGLTETLNETGPFTVFAPTDDAFAALGDTLDSLLENPEQLADVLQYHVIGELLESEQVVAEQPLTTLHGGEIMVELTEDGVILNGEAQIIVRDVPATNGVIHVIDTVLLPE